jgi:hypothetical protein
MSEPLSRDQAWDLFRSWTESESLRRHVLAVEAAVRTSSVPAGVGQLGRAVDLEQRLAERIVRSGGAVVSELAPDVEVGIVREDGSRDVVTVTLGVNPVPTT